MMVRRERDDSQQRIYPPFMQGASFAPELILASKLEKPMTFRQL
jgi:hypothetical protein